MKSAVCLLLGVCLCVCSWTQEAKSGSTHHRTFTNPVLPTGPDPWVEYDDGFYYYMNTTGTNLTVWKTRSMADLKSAEKKIV